MTYLHKYPLAIIQPVGSDLLLPVYLGAARQDIFDVGPRRLQHLLAFHFHCKSGDDRKIVMAVYPWVYAAGRDVWQSLIHSPKVNQEIGARPGPILELCKHLHVVSQTAAIGQKLARKHVDEMVQNVAPMLLKHFFVVVGSRPGGQVP